MRAPLATLEVVRILVAHKHEWFGINMYYPLEHSCGSLFIWHS